MDVEVRRHVGVDLVQEPPELGGAAARWRGKQRPITVPAFASRAANRLVVPWRT
jgi:hypothetical protein